MSLISILQRIKYISRRLSQTTTAIIKLVLTEKLYDPFHRVRGKRHQSVRILANGPSLKEFLNLVDKGGIDITTDDYCVVNDFVHDSHFEIIKPGYAVLSDPLFFIETIYSERGHRAMEAYAEKVSWPMYMIITYNYKDSSFLDAVKRNPNISLIILHNTGIMGEEFGLYTIFKKGYGNGQFGTVALNALYSMIQIGYKTIFFYGIDHTFFDNLVVNNKNQLCSKVTHFYGAESDLKPLLNHYDGLDKETSVFSVADYLYEKARIFKGHEILNSYAKSRDVQVYNCTPNSMVDAYDRL